MPEIKHQWAWNYGEAAALDLRLQIGLEIVAQAFSSQFS
jgi:hypothetical protein